MLTANGIIFFKYFTTLVFLLTIFLCKVYVYFFLQLLIKCKTQIQQKK